MKASGPPALAAALAMVALAPPLARAGECPGPTLRSSRPPPASTPWTDASLPPERRAELLLAEMSLEEKIDLATGESCLVYGFYNAPIDRLGIPALTMTDGPAGIRIPYRRVNDGRATQLPAPISVAASWDPALARAQGEVLGSEAFSTGHNVLLGPTLDLARDPLAGRTFEGFGEDPLLASRMAVATIQGIQSFPVLADAKHYAVYPRENDRFTLDAQVGERALREVYLRTFEAAAQEGHVASMMCGFNRVNGDFACEDGPLVVDVLKKDLGFDGFVLTDWGAIHDTRKAALGGTDQELPFAKYFGDSLLDAVAQGAVSPDVVDDKARRILRAMFRGGLFDRRVSVEPLHEAEDGARSRAIAEQGAVLLKNAGGLLPLSPDALRSIAVIGADAPNASTQGSGAARVEPTYTVSPLDAIRGRAGDGVRVEWAEGTDPVMPADLLPGPTPVPSSVLTPPGDPTAHGLKAEYWTNPTFDGDPDDVQIDREVAASAGFFSYESVHAGSAPPLSPRYALTKFSARWTGFLTAPVTGDYALTLTSRGRGWVWLDGALVIDHSEEHELATRTATVHLAAGEPHELLVKYSADSPDIGVKVDLGGDVKLGWELPPGAATPAVRDAASLAARSDVAVVIVRDYGTEERDRPSLALPQAQDDLIAAVAAANPRTIVVLTTGQPASLPWLDSVPAVLEAWYAGQEQGNAVARILFGDVNPSGKLPITFPRTLDGTPFGSTAETDGGTVRYSEGVLLGYRWYDANGVEPLFPFGFGLSYTTFRYGGLAVEPGPTARDASGSARGRVSFDVTNTGQRAGAEVAQVYVGSCSTTPDAPTQVLAGFAKVQLDPGQTARVSVDIAPEALSTWDEGAHAWQIPACAVPVQVASSSRDPKLAGELQVSADGSIAPAAAASGGGCRQGPGGGVAALAALLVAWLAARPGRRRGPSRPARA